MRAEEEKYDRVMNILRKSKPLLAGTGDIENNVMRRIREISKDNSVATSFLDCIFGWVYIGWVRRGLIAASVLIILVFAWQQSAILKRVNILEKQVVLSGNLLFTGTWDGLEEKIMLFNLKGGKTPESFKITEKQLDQLLKSYYEMEEKYGDLLKVIDSDPALKQYIETRLNQTNNRKLKL
jgi:hypothetical protein